jgi:hypothetical protein
MKARMARIWWWQDPQYVLDIRVPNSRHPLTLSLMFH